MKGTSAAIAAIAFIISQGCAVTVGTGGRGPSQTESKIIEKGNAELVEVEVAMGAGEMRLNGGSNHLMEGRFTFNNERWKPNVTYQGSSLRGRLDVRQATTTTVIGDNVVNEWEIKLADDVQMDLRVTLGAGESELKLGSLTLRSADIRLGAGTVDVDLRGATKKSCDISIKGGVGQATVRVPKETGVIATAKGGIGEVNVRGMRQDGDEWTTEAYGKSPTTIRLKVTGGIGQINIIAE